MQIKGLERNGTNNTGSIVINEGQDSAAHEEKLGSAEKRHLQADTDYARQLQAQMDVQEARGRNRLEKNCCHMQWACSFTLPKLSLQNCAVSRLNAGIELQYLADQTAVECSIETFLHPSTSEAGRSPHLLKCAANQV